VSFMIRLVRTYPQDPEAVGYIPFLQRIRAAVAAFKQQAAAVLQFWEDLSLLYARALLLLELWLRSVLQPTTLR
jgi:hypothetical protein